jgi:hypothetical protein
MGLDNYAGREPWPEQDLTEEEYRAWNYGLTEEDVQAFKRAEKEAEERTGGCCFIDIYFLGKIYQWLLVSITGVNVAQEWIPPETVRMMSDALQNCDPEQAYREFRAGDLPDDYRIDVNTILQLRVFFKVCADRGLGLLGSI